VRQLSRPQNKEYSYSLFSPVLFNTYINKIIQEFKLAIKKGIALNNRKSVNTILYADDRILMATSEDAIPPEPYSKKIQNDHIQHKNKINGNVWGLHTEGKFTACKRTQNDVEVTTFGKIFGDFLSHISTFRCWGSLASF
jgi:hypothetical protein